METDWWFSLEETDFSNIECLRIDTRDFHCIKFNFTEEFTNKCLEKLIPQIKKKHEETAILNSEELKEWLINLRTLVGGVCEWRMLNLKNIKIGSGWNCKYLTIIKYHNKFYISNDYELLLFEDFIKDNIDFEYLFPH